MASFADSYMDGMRQHVASQRKGIAIPAGLTEDEAVVHVIAAYFAETGVELDDADVRARVRAKMDGRETS